MRCSQTSIICAPGRSPLQGDPVLTLDKSFGNKASLERKSASSLQLAENGNENTDTMIDTVTGLYYLFRVPRVRNEGLVFRLHALTTILILAFSAIISSKQTVGNPIECVHTSTYFVTGAMFGVAGSNVAFPGVGPSFTGPHRDQRVNDQGTTKRVKYYQWVAFVLILQYVGNPIDCIHSKDLPEDVLNTYCWIHSTYTITAAYKKREGSEVPFPGVDNSKSHPESERKEYRYYQWVCFMLFLQVMNQRLRLIVGLSRSPVDRAFALAEPVSISNTDFFEENDESDLPLIEERGGAGEVDHYPGPKMPLMLKMIDIFGAIRSLFKVHRISEDSMIFRLHYRATVALLLTGCLTLACKSISGSPIHCEASGSVDKIVLETFCWLHTTYSMVQAFNKSIGQSVPYPGVSNSKGQGVHGHSYHPLVKQHKYYQWVIFFLLLQAILFYTPRWLWKGWEGGKIHALMMDLDIGLCSEVEKKQKKKMLLDYLWENLRFHNWWAYRYYLCEVLALLNVIGQMFLMNRFFDGAFLTFGIDVLRFLESDQEDRVDPMIYVFPRMTKCTFYKYGVSGEVERHDAVCILPLNVVNEKIYVFLWFWFLFLGLLSFITVLYRIVIIFSPRTRVYLLRLRFRLVRKDAVETIVRRSKVGDWFLLYMLGENLDTELRANFRKPDRGCLGISKGRRIPV
ncbi:hypothetical protein KM043_015638 [Ampulex compressa]|nr:hypothetical protein KM043_015638 [Ampulex compressa]